jgi:glycine/D-amino acid oxidase-like deaminating enzyme
LEGHVALRGLLGELGLSFGERVVEPFLGAKDYLRVRARSFAGLFDGGFGSELRISREDLALSDEIPVLSPKVRGFFIYSNEIFFDSDTLLRHLKGRLTRLGVQFVDRAVVKLTHDHGEGVLLLLRDGSFIRSDEVIVAAGFGSVEVLRSSGFSVDRLFATPGGRYEVANDIEQNWCVTHLKSSLIQFRRRVSLYGDFVSEGQRSDIHSTALVEFFMPSYLSRQEFSYAIANRLASLDRNPLIGPLYFPLGSKKRIFVASAFDKNGFQYADVAARNLLAQIQTQIPTPCIF